LKEGYGRFDIFFMVLLQRRTRPSQGST